MRFPPSQFIPLCLLLSLTCCSKSKEQTSSGSNRKAQVVPVVVATAEQREAPVELRAIGNVRAKATVAVKPRVTGQIAKVYFEEGQDVKEGDVLVKIDPAPFEVVLAQAKARLTQATIQAEIAKKQALRYTGLVQSGGVSREEVDNLKSAADAALSNTEAAAAAVREAELELSYCTVLSPITGRAGRRAIDAGNVVKEDETDLVVINQLQPVEVLFSVPEQYFGDIQKYMKQEKLKVSITPSGSASRKITGVLTFLDNAIKAATGTLEMKATMDNQDLALWPGQYGEVSLTLTTQPNAILIPAPAVQTGQEGQYVFVVKEDETVELRSIELDRTVGALAVIRKGLQKGEAVVLDGQLRLTPGVKVETKPPVGISQSAATTDNQLSQATETTP